MTKALQKFAQGCAIGALLVVLPCAPDAAAAGEPVAAADASDAAGGRSLAAPEASAAADAPVRASTGSDGVQRVDIVGGDYFFKPAHIVVKAGVPVALSVRVEPGIAPHSFVLEAPAAGISIDEDLAQEPKTLAFLPKAAGRYTFYCRNKLLFFKSHRERGMEGVLEVVE